MGSKICIRVIVLSSIMKQCVKVTSGNAMSLEIHST